MALICLNLESKIEELVLINSKIEPGKKEESAQTSLKNRAEEKRRMFLNFQILSLHHFALLFCNFSLCAASFYSIDQQQVRLFNSDLSSFKFLFNNLENKFYQTV